VGLLTVGFLTRTFIVYVGRAKIVEGLLNFLRATFKEDLMSHITGAFAPVPTPLDEGLAFDRQTQASHLRWLASERLDGALVLGTNGEFPSLSLDERRAVAEGATAADSGLDLILGVGSCALPEALAMVDLAASLGYDAVLCSTTFPRSPASRSRTTSSRLSTVIRTWPGSRTVPVIPASFFASPIDSTTGAISSATTVW
jgi:hypothetical protein